MMHGWPTNALGEWNVTTSATCSRKNSCFHSLRLKVPADVSCGEPVDDAMIRVGEVNLRLMAFGLVTTGALTIGVLTAHRVLEAERYQRQRTDPESSPQGDILLVLGARVLPEGPSLELRARLNHAVQRWQAGAADRIGVTGGIDGELDETEIMANYVISRGVPANAVRRIEPGENTRASMRATAAAEPGSTVLAVSSPYHAHRMVAEGRRCGLNVIADCPSDTPDTSNPDIRRIRLLSEWVGCLMYAAPPPLLVASRRVAVPARRWLTRAAAR